MVNGEDCYVGAGTPDTGGGATVPAVDPEAWARTVVVNMNLKPIDIGIVPKPRPGSIGIVGMPVWMWVKNPKPNTYGPLTRTDSDGPLTLRATAKVTGVDWNMGDGSKVIVCSKGQAYHPSYGDRESPSCGHKYTKTSMHQRKNRYKVTATSHWVINWVGGGESGTIPVTLSSEVFIRVGEAQTVN